MKERSILQSDLIDESEFTEVGEASEIDVDGDPTVYTRAGDSTSVQIRALSHAGATDLIA